jgi:ATP-binding cassette subfamily B protein RaxB
VTEAVSSCTTPLKVENSFRSLKLANVTGVALEALPSGFVVKDETARLPFSIFWTQMRGNRTSCRFHSIRGPQPQCLPARFTCSSRSMRLLPGDADLLIVLALGFGLLAANKVAANAIRSVIMVMVQNVLHFQIGARLFHHLVRLPMAYFEKRHIGDVLSRFTSIEPIRNALAEGMIAAAIDGVMAIATLTMIFVYSTQLGLVVLIAFVLYAITRLGLYRVFRERSQAVIETMAQENSTLIETVRAIQSLKLFNRVERKAYGSTDMPSRERQRFSRSHEDLIHDHKGFHIWVGDRYYDLSRGPARAQQQFDDRYDFAFMSYKLQFTEKAALLVEKVLDFRILELHLERLADVALTPLERGHDRPLAYTRQLQGQIELRHVSFRYAETEPFILEDINLVIEAGQSVTIMGPSGGGKTTLVKIMLGLLEPTSGEVLIDGVPLPTIGYRAYREQIGAVMQEDQLLSGSIADNICFFDTSFDSERMIRCARLAGIHDEIMAMTMTYNSLIGDMGSSLSGGQSSGCCSRALYHEPGSLMRAPRTWTSTWRINEALRNLEMTRISVAHRRLTGWDRIVHSCKTLEWERSSGRPPRLRNEERDASYRFLSADADKPTSYRGENWHAQKQRRSIAFQNGKTGDG